MRAGAMGGAGERRPPTEDETARIRAWLREGLEAGAVGMSTGLIYEPGRYTTTDELAMIARECADFGALYASHTRNEGAAVLEAHAEAMEIGRRAGIAVQISHHKASGEANWGRVVESIAQIVEARDRGEDVTADQYPYTASSTRLAAIAQNAREAGGEMTGESIIVASCTGHEEWEGKTLAQLAEDFDLPVDQAADRITDAVPATLIVAHGMSEDDVRTVLAHPTTMVGTDGLGYGSKPHPRHFGTYPRILGRYVREEGVLSLEDAIHKMTGMPAAKFDLPGRGVIAEGAVADLVLFDPDTVAEVSTYEDPRRAPLGMPHVFVNGVAVVRDGDHTHARAGRPVLRGRE
jgi:N-acyl-D-aspartate/D-glutamate deacylase